MDVRTQVERGENGNEVKRRLFAFHEIPGRTFSKSLGSVVHRPRAGTFTLLFDKLGGDLVPVRLQKEHG